MVTIPLQQQKYVNYCDSELSYGGLSRCVKQDYLKSVTCYCNSEKRFFTDLALWFGLVIEYLCLSVSVSVLPFFMRFFPRPLIGLRSQDQFSGLSLLPHSLSQERVSVYRMWDFFYWILSMIHCT